MLGFVLVAFVLLFGGGIALILMGRPFFVSSGEARRSARSAGFQRRDERIEPALLLDRRPRPVAGMNHRLYWEGVEHGANRSHDLLRTSAGKVGAPDAALEEGIAGEAVETEEKANRALRVPRGVERLQPNVMERDGIEPWLRSVWISKG